MAKTPPKKVPTTTKLTVYVTVETFDEMQRVCNLEMPGSSVQKFAVQVILAHIRAFQEAESADTLITDAFGRKTLPGNGP